MSSETIATLIADTLPRELILTIDELLEAGAARAYQKAIDASDGHLPHVVGTMRHFCMNEGFYAALEGNGGAPTQVRGNRLVVGRVGMIQLARFNTHQGPWNNARRSKQRLVLAQANKAIEPLVIQDLLDPQPYVEPATITVFFAAVFSPHVRDGERPISIEIAVPDKEMRGWLFREPVELFVRRYTKKTVQEDKARPTLKINKENEATPPGS
ncbi:alpha/beta hydrolase [Luteibacter sp. SG786]|uniref:alpha/beta hydrolase n=1 Tax=Luteibacter sp. SG786 TaxID=2587130 RepID=UPI0014202A40|nr:alpha/beta hydrolase [Luteibacter sp. SG786]NII56109.1 hypothetical protein [Luteibacter sp. SG786]